jgi:hypothetical protein
MCGRSSACVAVYLWLGSETVLRIEHALVLQTVVLEEVIPDGCQKRNSDRGRKRKDRKPRRKGDENLG